MKMNTKRKLALLIFSMIMTNLLAFIPQVNADTTPAVVINEVAWMGTQDSANDEWIELYNNTDAGIDLSGWYIEDDDSSSYVIPSGTIPAHGYFLIEDAEETINSITADAIIGLSLANSGDKLVLKNASGTVIDTVNGSGGAWYAGNNTSKTTMERVDAGLSTDDVSNWADNKASNGALGRTGITVQGTPKSQNSVSIAEEEMTKITLQASDLNPKKGQTIGINAIVENAENLFSYGFTVNYDSAVLEYVSAQSKGFLSENGNVSTSFYAGLENSTQGKLIVAEARTTEENLGISGDGNLFSMTFKVVGEFEDSSSVSFYEDSFLSDPNKDILSQFVPISIKVASGEETSVDPVQNIQASPGTQRYTIEITWNQPTSGADSYRVLRKNQSGNYVEIGTTSEPKFTDTKDVIPTQNYSYQVIAVKGDSQSPAEEISGTDVRGLLGDFNRSDRVDGRDLLKLAQHFGEDLSDSDFDAKIDTNYDGVINGSDLLDMAANWALTYGG